MDWLTAILPGIICGCAIWYMFFRPRQLNEHERRRRACGLPPRRRLPEDQ